MEIEKDVVPLKFANTMLRVAEAQGYDLDDFLQSLNLDPADFSPLLDPESKIPAHSYSKIYSRVMWLLQDESFGLNLKHNAPTGSFRMMCLVIIHCNNLEHAIRRAAEFNSFCNNLSGRQSMFSYPIKRLRDGTAEYRFPSSNQLLDSPEDLRGVAHCVAIWRRFCSWLIGKNIELIEVSFQSPEPKNRYYIDQIFKYPLRFDEKANTFRFSENYLQLPLIHTEDSLRTFLRNAPYHLLASAEEDDSSILAQMKRIIGNDFSRDFPSVVEMASNLNMSVRTLRRRLKDIGTTYQHFKDGLRRDAACSYLNRPELKINAVSALLGFDEPSAFHRSFKKWTGITPGEYRSQNRESNGSPAQ